MKTTLTILLLLFSLTAAAQAIIVYDENNQPKGYYLEDQFGGYEVYENNAIGVPVKTGEIRPNFIGGYDVFEVNDNGVLIKTDTYLRGYSTSDYERDLNSIPLPATPSPEPTEEQEEEPISGGVISY